MLSSCHRQFLFCKFTILVQLRLMGMSPVLNVSLLKSQAKSKFQSDDGTERNVYWLISVCTMNYEINTIFSSRDNTNFSWVHIWVTFSPIPTITCLHVCQLQSALSTGWQMACLFSFFAVPISNVTLKASETNLVEFNDTAVLMCSVSKGTSLSYVWMNGSSVVTAGGGVQFSNGGANLTIAMVTRYDKGPFTCNVSNGISHEISAPVQLNISCEFSQDNVSANSINKVQSYNLLTKFLCCCSTRWSK